MKTTLDGARIRNLRLSRGIPQRQLTNAAGMDIATLRRLETNGLSDISTFSVAQLVRVADYLDVHISDLFTTTADQDQEAPDRPALSDVQLLGATLLDLGKSTRTKAVSEIFGWNSRQVHQVADALDETLRPVGMTLRHTKGVLRLSPLDDRHQPVADQLRKHPLARISQRLVTRHRARLIYAMEAKPLSNHSVSEKSLTALALLCRVNMVKQDGSGKFIVTDDVLHSLYPEGYDRKALESGWRKTHVERLGKSDDEVPPQAHGHSDDQKLTVDDMRVANR
jgi:transcriptional regulator with XRE-family HTH domain